MIDRRNFMLAALGTVLAPATMAAGMRIDNKLAWVDFSNGILQLAAACLDRQISQQDMMSRGVELLRQLDTSDDAFLAAVQASWESGNRYWLWQRLSLEKGVTGGILAIDRDQDVPMHDHPGATGMIRVLTGKVEVWQYDRSDLDASDGHAILELVSHRLLLPGDNAVLSPDRGNIHALRAHSKSCRMLDYFIPPYERSKRTWYRPVDNSWHDRDRVLCRSIHEHDFYMT